MTFAIHQSASAGTPLWPDEITCKGSDTTIAVARTGQQRTLP
jgi:hypothetical protein